MLSCKINCYFRTFLTSSFYSRLSICSFHTFHFRTFYRFQSAITGSQGNFEKDGDGLRAIPGWLAGHLFLTVLLSYRSVIIIRRLITFLRDAKPTFSYGGGFFGRRRPRESSGTARRMRNESSDECKGGILTEGF